MFFLLLAKSATIYSNRRQQKGLYLSIQAFSKYGKARVIRTPSTRVLMVGESVALFYTLEMEKPQHFC